MTTLQIALINAWGGGAMRELRRESGIQEWAPGFAAGAALLLAALSNFIAHNAYPFFRAEVAWIAAGLLAVSAVMPLFYRAQRQWGRSLLEGLLVALFLDLNAAPALLTIAAGTGVALVSALRRTSLLAPMAIMGTVILVLTISGVGVRPSWINSTESETRSNAAVNGRPAVLHIILDEHIGLGGLPTDERRAVALRDQLRRFYLSKNFVVYGGAYSEHLHTINSIPNILNYGRGRARQASLRGAVIGPTRHFQQLRRQGYDVKVFQSDFADYCAGAGLSSCITYDSSALGPTLEVPMKVRQRAKLLAYKFANLSTGLKWSAVTWNMVAGAGRRIGWGGRSVEIEEGGRSSTVAAFQAVQRLEKQIARLQPGEAQFAHLLLPHYPYVVDEQCRYLPVENWKGRRSKLPGAVRRQAYYGQLSCTTRLVGRLLDALDRSPAGKNSVIIIHGDHGSRITNLDPNVSNMGRFSQSDVIAGFSTLFAVRAPGIAPAYIEKPLPVSSLLRDFTNARFAKAPEPIGPLLPLQLDDWEWHVRQKMDLPSGWMRSQSRSNVTQH